ncbi:MAG: purine-nucleoside phosphorylase [Oscillospiraceae bacterium]|nr:purine-nucleoside phosphorylase [Oscillospiraceae bacterium]
MPTPHNEASVGSIAKTVLMPGDPRRSQFIAETFLENPALVNNVRGVHGYTGTWKGVPVTVMASGMGIPSIGIYSWELYSEYNVENIIRIGSAGALQDNLRLMDVILAQGCCTTSNYIENFGLRGTFAPIADFTLLSKAREAADALGLSVHIGNLLSSDNFYSPFGIAAEQSQKWKQMGVLGIEMEAAGLYANAAYFGKRALCICTVSDHLFRPEMLTAEERQLGFRNMITIALDTAAAMGE